MKKNLLYAFVGFAVSMTSADAWAQDVTETLPVKSDVTLTTDSKDKAKATEKTIEMYTSRTDGAITREYLGLMSFQVPVKAGYAVKSANLRLVTERAKGTLAIYGLGAEVSDADTYNSQIDNVDAARETTPIATVKLNGTANKAVTDAGASANLQDWVNNIDITDYVKSVGSAVNLVLLNNAASTTTSIKVYSSDTEDVTNTKVTPNFTFSADDLKPQLTIVYEVDADQKSDVSSTTADTWIRKGNKDNHGGGKTLEVCTYDGGTDASKAKEFLGLMSFKVPAEALTDAYEVKSASLRLVTERVKGARGISLYVYPEFEENAIYENEADKVATAKTDDNFILKFDAKGSNKAMGVDALPNEYKAVEAWTNTLDLTNYVKALDKNTFSLLFVKDNASESTTFYTKEQTTEVVNAKDETVVFAAADLVPQLTIVYAKKGTDGVENVTVNVPATINGKVYNLQGVQMNANSLPAGIYVRNGKKFVVK